jgi:fructoselysine-6-P-deglycase FrlB-like protein
MKLSLRKVQNAHPNARLARRPLRFHELTFAQRRLRMDAKPVSQITTSSLQMLAYHIAAIRGLDVDQPRNLAKSVTVE